MVRGLSTGRPGQSRDSARRRLAALANVRPSEQRHPDRDDWIEDMAKGLCSAMESDQKLVGPLMQHYRCLAVALASAFDPHLIRSPVLRIHP